MTTDHSAALAAYGAGWERLDQGVESLLHCCAPDIRFIDPFNDLTGREALRMLLAKTYAEVENPRFSVTRSVIAEAGAQDAIGYLDWVFRFGAPGAESEIIGLSRIRLDAAGLVTEHQDFWDPTGPVYRKVPGLGWIMTLIANKLGV